MADLEHRSISERIRALADSVDNPDHSEELEWIAYEIFELERQLEETTTIRRFQEALSSSLESMLEETLNDLESVRLHKRELAWFLYVESSDQSNEEKLVTMTIAANSLRLRCGNNRSELDLHELNNFVLKGHQDQVRDMITEALISVCDGIKKLSPTD